MKELKIYACQQEERLKQMGSGQQWEQRTTNFETQFEVS